MVNLAPSESWLYLIILGSVLAFFVIFGLVIGITQRRKKKKKAEEAPVE